jgi:hypothetical protein
MSDPATITHKQQTGAWSEICDLEDVVARIKGLGHALALMAASSEATDPAFTAIADSIMEEGTGGRGGAGEAV